jgi:hypothetical protein
MKTRSGFAFCAAALLLVSCSSSSGGGGSSGGSGPSPSAGSGGSLWDRLDAARAERSARAERGGDAAFDANAGAAAIPAEDRARYETWWRRYVENDARWEASKAEWLKTRPPGPTLLAENLLRRHVLAYDSGVRSEYERAGRELASMPSVAAPLLIAGLRGGAGDTLVRQHAAALLGDIGPSALPSIEAALADADDQGRWELTRAVSRMKSPATTATLARVAARPGAFGPRIEAVKGLSENGDSTGYDAVVALLQDSDPSVRKFAARYSVAYGRKEVVEPLIACMERCERERDREGVDEVHRALSKATGLEAPREPAAWRAVLRRAGYDLRESR